MESGPGQHTGQSRPYTAPLSQIMQNDEQPNTTNWNTVLAVSTYILDYTRHLRRCDHQNPI